MKYHTKEKAFTLAEVLITLGIIGIVAAMTMPALIVSHKEKETSVKLKKVYSTLSQAYISATNKYEAPENWNWAPPGSVSASDMILDYFAEYLVVSKRCTNSPKCLPDVMYKRLNGTNHSNYHNEGTGSTLILNDGTAIYLWVSGLCSAASPDCGFIFVDINGKTGPNQFGRDFFGFILSPTAIIPFGIKDHSHDFYTSCNRNTDSYLNGLGCTAWVIQNENMDYLHCDDLSFEGKTKCK